MSEINEFTPTWGGFKDFSDTFDRKLAGLRRRRAVRSADELAAISRMRADGHVAANLFRDFYVGTAEQGTEELRRKLTEAESALARWALMGAHEEFHAVDLARIDNRGEWEATSAVEADIATIATTVRAAGDGGQVIDRHAPEAKRRIMVDPTLVAASGLVAVRRKRLMLATANREVHFRDSRNGRALEGREMVARSRVEIDKVSEFILDLTVLRRVSARAAREIGRVIDGMSPVEITNHEPALNLVSPRLIEAAIDVRHPMLTPAVTTYFADRKYSDIKPVEPTEQVQAA